MGNRLLHNRKADGGEIETYSHRICEHGVSRLRKIAPAPSSHRILEFRALGFARNRRLAPPKCKSAMQPVIALTLRFSPLIECSFVPRRKNLPRLPSWCPKRNESGLRAQNRPSTRKPETLTPVEAFIDVLVAHIYGVSSAIGGEHLEEFVANIRHGLML
jgi:hypothetical protein